MKELTEIYVVYACCVLAVVIFGSAWDTYIRERKAETVQCSYEVENMAKNINVTLVGQCEIWR